MGDAWRSHVRGDLDYSTGNVYRDSFRSRVLGFIAYFVISCMFSIVPCESRTLWDSGLTEKQVLDRVAGLNIEPGGWFPYTMVSWEDD